MLKRCLILLTVSFLAWPVLGFSAAVPSLAAGSHSSAKPEAPHGVASTPKVTGKTSDSAIYVSLQTGYVPPATDKWVNRSNNGTVYTKYKSGPSFSVAVGYHFNAHWRADLQALYIGQNVRRIKFTTFNADLRGSERAYSLMANGYYDFKNKSKFTPYLGAGFGYTVIRVQNKREAAATYEGLAYIRRPSVQGIVGLNYALTQHFSLGLNYTLFYTFPDKSFDFVEHDSGNSVIYKNTGYLRNIFNLTASYSF
ncbi:MAG: hypothetical protein COV52_02205 [Gammaproteobacteria bacterium CG11_big_fil_rev_8_21_14_0_20_46_22]|nr:MAG: hypothetical protein COW05_00475 [Gammaproteobacteria bacterium CG12_big_fil_rev_8_21_14_0_65_46_12]PIR11780.1 MAG: hypothetical protein COV52_02205 [Gammaproteobacteria bacterium CG11_big_fil_rev_8_21_14_0_20_46_22]